MSGRMVSAVWDVRGLRPTERLVLLALAEFADHTGVCWPSVEAIAERTELGRSTVIVALRDLDKAGLVARTHRQRRARAYQLTLTAPAISPDPGPLEEAPISPAPGLMTGSISPAPGLPVVQLLDFSNKNPSLNPSPSLPATPQAAPPAKPKRERKPKPRPQPRADVQALCDQLVAAMVTNGNKPPTVTVAWLDSARLLLDRDGRPADEATAVLAWSQQDGFWSTNIHSMPTFRRQYDKLRQRWKAEGAVTPKPTDLRAWLNEQWKRGKVREICERTGLMMPPLNLPIGATTPEQRDALQLAHRQRWITDHRDDILRRMGLTTPTTTTAAATPPPRPAPAPHPKAATS